MAMSGRVGQLIRKSTLRETAPLVLSGEDASQVPSYLNGAALYDTTLQPREIIEVLHAVERDFGRRRETESKRWQSRVIDLDLLALDETVFHEPGLTIPHPELHRRDFMLEPFAEIWPEWKHPIEKASASQLLRLLRAQS